MRPLAALLLLALLCGLPAASAQTLVQPVKGAYEEVYVVTGRIVDARGEPAAGADLTVELTQPGVRAAPLKATANCKGDFITSFTLRSASRQGAVTVAVHARDGGPDAKATQALDPFFRRTDLVVRLDRPWGYSCGADDDVWPLSVSVTGRLLNRTDPREKDGATYEAEPYRAPVRLRYTDADGNVHCPPAANAPPGVCDLIWPDERGDFRYTFTFGGPIDPNGTMAILVGETPHFVEVDPSTRQAVFRIEATGRGAPAPPAPATPGPGALLLAVALAGAALAARRRART